MSARVVETLDLPELAPYRTLRRPFEHLRAGIFVAEGGPVVERLLHSPLRVLSLLMTPQWFERLGPLVEARARDAVVYLAPQSLLESIIGVHLHQGVMAVALVPPPRSLDELVTASRPPRLVLALDGVSSPENLGCIVRTCAAFEVTALVVGETAASPWLRRAVRTSMGAVVRVPICHVSDLGAALLRLRSVHGFAVLATSPVGATSLAETDLGGDCCLLLGHEGFGVRSQLLAACDRVVGIPMPEGVDSLNVAAAAAVMVYEATRQRQGRSSTPPRSV